MIFRSPLPDVEIPNRTFGEVVLRHASDQPNKPALIDGPSGRTLTYGQLAGAARLVASSLARRGLRKGDTFAIYSPNLPEYAIAFHAVAMLGGIVTTVNPLYTATELAHQLEDSRARFLLTVPPFIDNARAAAAQAHIEELFVFGEAEGATSFASLLQSDGALPAVQIDAANDVLVLPYSSGTTGLPKGVMLTHRNLVANTLQTDAALTDDSEIRKDDVLIGILPFFHIYGMVVVMSIALYKGATVVSMPRFDLEQFLTILDKYAVTWAPIAPPIALAMAKHPLVDKFNLSSLRVMLSGAAPLGSDVEQAAAARLGCYVTQGYGMTESSPVIHVRAMPGGLEKRGSIGQVIPNTEVLVTDIATRAPLGPNQEGEIWARGPQVMTGYLNNPEATRNTIDEEGWLRTGDIGYADDRGYFYIVDRLKELIKYKGYQVAPAELEAVLLAHPAVADAAVIGVKSEESGEEPKAFVVLKGEATQEEIIQFVAERVAPYKKIRLVDFISQVPKSSSGKILRRVLVDQERAKGQ